jgi:hypothetical protein
MLCRAQRRTGRLPLDGISSGDYSSISTRRSKAGGLRRLVRYTLPLIFFAAGGLFPTLKGDPITIDFEGFPDSTILANQYPGLAFINAIVLTAGISLNEFEFPPHSGVNVASDNGGPILILFNTPVLSFGGYFTYVEPLTVVAFDSAETEVSSAGSLFSSNDALFGDFGSSPNEFLEVDYASGISSVTITGDPNGGSFVMDDIGFTSAVPEPSSLLLFLTAVLGFRVLRTRTSR